MRRQIQRATLHFIGWLLILVGVCGLILPILPGFVLILIGVYALSLTSIWFKTKKDSIVLKYPQFTRIVTWLDTKFGHLNIL